MNMKDLPGITEALLMEKLGPSPKVSAVARFLDESTTTTWRRLSNNELEALPGSGNIRISLKSLAKFLNGSRAYELTHKRGKRPGENPRTSKNKTPAK
jgi:hypothetical protein